MTLLLLQLKDSIHQCFAGGRTAGHVDVDGDDAIAAPGDAVTVMVIPAAVGAAAHTDDPARLGHLVINHAQRRSHLVRQRAGDDHHVGLPRRGAEDDSKSVLVVAWGGKVHHFYGAACEAEGHGPQGALTRPVGDLVEGCSGMGGIGLVGWG